MKTNQIMQSVENRMIQVQDKQIIIRQRTKDSFFALNDIVLLCDYWLLMNNKNNRRFNIQEYLRQKPTKEFIEELESKTGDKCYIRGAKSKTGWVHPFLMLDILLWANPKFKVEVYSWLNDFLIQNRVSSGDSYVRMCGVLYKYSKQKSQFNIAIRMIGKQIKDFIGVSEWNKANQEQLKRRDELQNFISDLAETIQNSKEAVRLGFVNYKRKYLKDEMALSNL